MEMTAEIARLIERLAGDEIAQRDAAQAALVKIGQPAAKALETAAGDKDVERAIRAKAALAAIRKQSDAERIRSVLPKGWSVKVDGDLVRESLAYLKTRQQAAGDT